MYTIHSIGNALVMTINDNSRIDHRGASLVRVMAFEPFTWSWLGLKLAEGALGFIASKLIGSLFGDDVLDDLGGVIERAVTELKKFIKDTVDENTINQASSHIRSLQSDLRFYTNAPKTSGDRIVNADHESSRLVALVESYGPKLTSLYCVAIGLRIDVLLARAEHFEEQGEQKNAGIVTRSAIQTVSTWVKNLEETALARIKSVSAIEVKMERRREWKEREPREPHEPIVSIYTASFTVDGAVREYVGYSRVEVESRAKEDRDPILSERELAREALLQNITQPAMATVAVWENLATKLP